MKQTISTFFLLLIFQFTLTGAPTRGIQHNVASNTITINNEQLVLLIDYSTGCKVTQLQIGGEQTLSTAGVYTGIRTKNGHYTSLNSKKVQVTETKNGLRITGITYGDSQVQVSEVWHFELHAKKILWDIEREYHNNKPSVLEETDFPKWNFANLSVWKGGILDNGGMVWCKYLSQVNDTYGVHTGGVTFWNPDLGKALRIAPTISKDHYIAAKYSQSELGEFTYTQLITDSELGQRYNLNRFVDQKSDVFAPFEVKKGKINLLLELEYIDYASQYSRGTLVGIDAVAVRELMNTTGRYGVVDNRIIGANGWLTNWKCLHEPFFAQTGLALNDPNYTKNMQSTLDQERDLAMLDNGRVLSRWHNAPGDEMPGTYNLKTGYYEAMWGYTVDSQTGYVINTAEQFDLCGNLKWLQQHKLSCEKALDWLIARDVNKNGIFEMMSNNIAERKASDWLDIVWAGFENAFVNAQMYEALNLWANCEQVLGDKSKSDYYTAVAARLKTSFNKPVAEGGFWMPEKKQYIYWRDQDGSIHGDNLVTPVNFAAIAFGLCDDPTRVTQILEQIEQRTVAEQLFHWPLCFDSFRQNEVHANNWPFPKYENGDIFPTWGYLGVRAYTQYDRRYNKAIGLKYIRNILAQYNKDGLSSQRYSRVTQLGLGTDILAGISTSVTALYRDIYGLRPKWNRMGLEPNMDKSLNGTQFQYTHLNTPYTLDLSVDAYRMACATFSIKSATSFGANQTANRITYYHNNQEKEQLQIDVASQKPLDMEIGSWSTKDYSWTIKSADNYSFRIQGLIPGSKYILYIDTKWIRVIDTGTDGSLTFKHHCTGPTSFSLLVTRVY